MRFYIDPGTGSMLFAILIGVIGAGIYSVKMLLIKLRFRLSGGKAEVSNDKIPLAIFSDDKRYWNIFAPICRELEKLGFEVLPSKANFLFAKSDKIGGRELYLLLKEKGVLVRHFHKDPIKDYNRITIGSQKEMEIFIDTVKEILGESL